MASEQSQIVPSQVINPGHLPPMQYRDLPEPLSWKKMVGPSIMLAGLALGSGEFLLWPDLVFRSGFVFFWACILGVITQFFLNMEIERWTLVTGESAITGFCRMSWVWAWVMLLFNIVPWAWPGWATGAGTILSWLLFGPVEETVDGKIQIEALYVSGFGIAGLLLTGIVLTAGPVVYNTVEKIQTFLVSAILILVVVIAAMVIRVDAVLAMVDGILGFEMPDAAQFDLTTVGLLGAIAFAGAGGTTNLGQSNLIKDKGYGMGKYIGRITSPITGAEEATSDIGFHFPATAENQARWRNWWRAANIEHFFSFFVTCIVCLCLMTLITYSLYYDSSGEIKSGADQYGSGMSFIWGQAMLLEQHSLGRLLKPCFLLMGIAILLTTELGVLDTVARISTDLVKVNFLRNSERWSLSRLYFFFLWGQILLGVVILLNPGFDKPLLLIKTAAAMNGGVMFVYSVLLIVLNRFVLPPSVRIGTVRLLALAWAVLFFGYFSMIALTGEVIPYVRDSLGF